MRIDRRRLWAGWGVVVSGTGDKERVGWVDGVGGELAGIGL